jgi:hypothetical protein
MKDARIEMQTSPDSSKPKRFQAFRRLLIKLGIMPPPEGKGADQSSMTDEQRQGQLTPIEELERMRTHD